MENSVFFTNRDIYKIGEIIPDFIKYYELNKKIKKRDDLYKSILEIIDKFSKEDLFKNVDKLQLFRYLDSRMHLLEPYDIKKDELARRLRKIMAVEAMSRILDGLSPEQVEKLVRSFK